MPPGDTLTVSDAILWAASDNPGHGHYCFIAIVSCAKDPAPPALYFRDVDDYVAYVRDENNVTWRNFDVIDPTSSTSGSMMGIVIPGADEGDTAFQIIVDAALPPGFRPVIVVPGFLHRVLGRPHPPRPTFGHDEDVPIECAPNGVTELGAGTFPKRMRAQCHLRLQVPDGYRIGHVEPKLAGSRISIIQRYEGVEVGRFTWVIARPRRH